MNIHLENKTLLDKITQKGLQTVVSSFGILCGLTGFIAGVFEILQGNLPTNGFEISTIGLGYAMANDFTYYAVTIAPTLLLSGILACILSCATLIWSVRFIDKRFGATVLLILCLSQMLVGGGWVIDIALITCALATRINTPLSWWRTHLPNGTRKWLVKIFPISVVIFALISGAMLILTIFGVNSQLMIDALSPLAGLMFLPILLMIFGAIATDIQNPVILQ
jgi:hypothetical protein